MASNVAGPKLYRACVDVLGRAIQKRMTEHSTMADLRRFLGEEWQRIPQATIQKLVFSTWKTY